MKTKGTLFQGCLIGFVLLTLPAAAQAQFTYTKSGGAVTITGYTGSDTAVTIPSTLDGLPVKSIGDSAFDSSGITSVVIPNSVTYIGPFAFHFCQSLTNVNIPNSVTYIDIKAFGSCSGLRAVTIPDGVKYIEEYAFALCVSLVTVTIPNSVTNLGDGVFLDCTGITSVTIGTGLKTINASEFDDCRSLTNILIPNNVTSIGSDGFTSCLQLGSINIPLGLTNIASGAFVFCDNLTAFNVDAANPAYSSINGVLFDKNKTTLVEYPNGLSGNYSIPASVTNIESDAFGGSSDLTGVSIPNGITSIADGVFGDCTSLTGVTIPNSVTNIGFGAFAGTSLTSIVIPSGVTSVLDGAFYQCFNLSRVYFQGDAPPAGSQVFYNVPGVVFYLAGAKGWGATYDGLPTVMLGSTGQVPSLVNVTAKADEFGFSLPGVSNEVVVVEASTNLTDWESIQTNTLSGASFNFTDSQWQSYPRRFYRVALAQSPVARIPYTWTTNNDGTITIVGYTGPGGEIEIPTIVTGRPVTGIGPGAFYSQSVLLAATIPATVTSIGPQAFGLCYKLVEFNVNPADPAYASVNGVILDKSQTTLVVFPGGVLGDYTIPSGVSSIADFAFDACALTTITVPASVTGIGDYAFVASLNLTGFNFLGNAPALGGPNVFLNDPVGTTVYYQTGTSGWGPTYGGLPTVAR